MAKAIKKVFFVPTSNTPFLSRKNLFVLKACTDISFLLLFAVNRSLHSRYNLHFYKRPPSHTFGNRTTRSPPSQSKKHLHPRRKSLLRFQRKHQTLLYGALLWMTIWQKLHSTSTKKKKMKNKAKEGQTVSQCNETIREKKKIAILIDSDVTATSKYLPFCQLLRDMFLWRCQNWTERKQSLAMSISLRNLHFHAKTSFTGSC